MPALRLLSESFAHVLVAVAAVSAAIRARAEASSVSGQGRPSLAGLLARYRSDAAARANRRPTRQSRAARDYGRVLVALDLSEHSRGMARQALLSHPAAQIVFLHALGAEEEEATAEAMAEAERRGHPAGSSGLLLLQARRQAAMETMNRLVDELAPAQLVSCVAHYGAPPSVIRNYAGRMRADLIVIGKPGRQSRMNALLAETGCEVLVAAVPPRLSASSSPATTRQSAARS
jgi:nucleotide-binding universal stress UspA family protein